MTQNSWSAPAVPVGKALVEAKQAYLAGTPVMRGIHEKAYLGATLFGLPMLSADLPNRSSISTGAPLVGSTNGYTTNPGSTLGLRSADVSISPTNLQQRTVNLENIGGEGTVQATYFSGTHGVVANPAEPVLPLNLYNASVANLALRGIDRAIDSFHARVRRPSAKVNTLFYCHDAVMEEYANYLQSRLGDQSSGAPGDRQVAVVAAERQRATVGDDDDRTVHEERTVLPPPCRQRTVGTGTRPPSPHRGTVAAPASAAGEADEPGPHGRNGAVAH